MRLAFYVVWQPDTGAPRYRHSTEYQATAEAERLAASNPGKEFYVLQALTVSQHNVVRTERLEQEEQELPF